MRAAAPADFRRISLHPAPDATGSTKKTRVVRAKAQKRADTRADIEGTTSPPTGSPRPVMSSFERLRGTDRPGVLPYQTLGPEFATETPMAALLATPRMKMGSKQNKPDPPGNTDPGLVSCA